MTQGAWDPYYALRFTKVTIIHGTRIEGLRRGARTVSPSRLDYSTRDQPRQGEPSAIDCWASHAHVVHKVSTPKRSLISWNNPYYILVHLTFCPFGLLFIRPFSFTVCLSTFCNRFLPEWSQDLENSLLKNGYSNLLQFSQQIKSRFIKFCFDKRISGKCWGKISLTICELIYSSIFYKILFKSSFVFFVYQLLILIIHRVNYTKPSSGYPTRLHASGTTLDIPFDDSQKLSLG